MKKYEPNKLMDCPKCGYKAKLRINYGDLISGQEYISVICRNCGYYESTLPLDDNGKREEVVA